jgi:phospho-N-acetylmuramoyl-pentapeptide-transferase
MGGIIIIGVTILVYSIISSHQFSGYIVLLAALATAALGLVDDVGKVVHERSLGLPARYKMIILLAISMTVGLLETNYGGASGKVTIPLTRASLAFDKWAITTNLFGHSFYIPWLYLIFVFLLFSATANSVNLTDGLDGLAAGTVTIIMLAYAGIAFKQDNLDLAILAAAVSGSCIGFLWYNSYPADIFMGDTGSLGLGGIIAALAIVTHTELLLILIGGIYVIEALSVIIQVAVFRLSGNRVFKMAPIHHHFEILGWSETKVMIRFWIITGVFSGAGFALYFISALGKG